MRVITVTQRVLELEVPDDWTDEQVEEHLHNQAPHWSTWQDKY
jgi:hypothetical protein